jgi:hypothetical protein
MEPDVAANRVVLDSPLGARGGREVEVEVEVEAAAADAMRRSEVMSAVHVRLQLLQDRLDRAGLDRSTARVRRPDDV